MTERLCETCGGSLSARQRRFCSRPCTIEGWRGEKNPNWRGDDATASPKRHRAQVYRLGPCERCGKPGVDRHHRDDDIGNNAPENIASLCRRCHMEIDGRLAALAARAHIASAAAAVARRRKAAA